jgi:hypothetical protein
MKQKEPVNKTTTIKTLEFLSIASFYRKNLTSLQRNPKDFPNPNQKWYVQSPSPIV